MFSATMTNVKVETCDLPNVNHKFNFSGIMLCVSTMNLILD